MKAARGLILTVLCMVGCSLTGLVASASALPASFGLGGTGAGEFLEPRGIAVDQESGDVYVADEANNRIDKFGPEGEFLMAWGWGVADGKTEALQTCTTTCFPGLAGAGAGEFNGAEGIAVDNSLGFSHGDLYVADTRNSRIEKFGPNGEFLLQFGSEGTGPGQFKVLTKHAVAVDQTTGIVYVADESRVQRFDEAGVVQGGFAVPGGGWSLNLTVSSPEAIFLESEKLPGVREYDSTGKETPPPRDEAGHVETRAVTTGPAGELFINDFRASEEHPHHILSFDPAGKQTASFDAGGAAQDAKRGIAWSEHASALYVLNEAAVRIVTPPPVGPVVVAGSETATGVGTTTASLGASVNPEGAATTYHLEYGKTAAYGESTPVSAPLTAVNAVQSVTVAATGGGFTLAFKGEACGEIPFNATAAEVQAALEGIPGLGAGQVAVSGQPGGPWSVEFTGARAGQAVPELSANSGNLTGPEPGAVVATTTPGISLFDDRAATAPITKLQPGTLYHYRVVATNGTQTTDGPDATFETLPPVSIDSTSVTEVDDQTARLEAELNPHGLASEYRFEYDTSPYAAGEPPHGTSIPIPDASLPAATTDVSVSELVQGLAPATTYYYRVLAHNGLGTSDGPGRSFTTETASSSTLPDGRAWELVSPPNKHGAPIEPIGFEGGMIQAAAAGGAVTYVARGPIGEESKATRSPEENQLFSVRDPRTGWSTQDITTPHEELSLLLINELAEYKLFGEDLSSAVVEPLGATPLSPHTTERTPYRREADGEFVPLVTAANVPSETKFGGELEEEGTRWGDGVKYVAATPDLSHIALSSRQALTAGFKEGFKSNLRSLYELTGGALTLVSVLTDGTPAAEDGRQAKLGESWPTPGMRGAISSDGTRVFFNAGSELLMRDVGLSKTIELDKAQPGATGASGSGGFQAASTDGSRVFFTDTTRLTADSTAREGEPDLYMCEIGVVAGEPTCALTDLTVDHTPGEAANVQKLVLALDTTGAHIYFVAKGVLTDVLNARGEHALPGSPNLYEYDTGSREIHLVAVLSSNDLHGVNSAGLVGSTARVSPNGRYFAFMSQRSLTGYDNRDARSGQPDAEVFLFDADSGALHCVSCDPSGARPHGLFDSTHQLLADLPADWGERWIAAMLPGWTAPGGEEFSYQSRFVSDSGRTFFDASDGLVPQDTNGVMDVYQYEPPGVGNCATTATTYASAAGGCVGLISSGTSPQESTFLDASENGDEVFFLTAARLTTNDVDSAFDVYDAHACSASSLCPPAASSIPACEGDSCQNPGSPPNDSTPGSLTYQGPGNLTPPTIKPVARPKAKTLTRAQRLTKALKVCHAKRGKKRRTCEKTARKNYGPINKTAKPRARKGAK